MWTIGEYLLDPTSFELRRDGKPIALQRRPLDVLLYLVARPNRVVSREDLHLQVWGGVAVSPGSLSTAVYQARAAIGDLERAPDGRWLETVRGRGFRFCGPVEWIADPSTTNGAPKFVGRESLVAELAGDIRRAESGRGGIRVIEGLAGMGKTRLVQEATRGRGTAVVRTVHCERGGPPYWPWLQLIRVLTPGRSASGSDEAEWVDAARADGAELHFEFERVDRTLQVLKRAAESRPLVLVIEDIHWADVSSLGLLEALSHRLDSIPVLVLATHRTGELEDDSARAGMGSARIRRDRLDPLSVIELYDLVRHLIGRVPSPEFIGWVQRHSGGVPLMVRELADQVDPDDTALPDLPQLAKLMLARRFDGLAADSRLAISVAALCGERFDVPLVEAAIGSILGDSRAWVRDGLSGGILVADARNPLRLAFRHSLLRDAARGGLSAEDTAEWHGRLARALEQMNPDAQGAMVAQLARHFAAGALVDPDLERPLRYALLAARNASDVFAWEEVRVHSEHALGWVGFMPPGPERDAREIDAALLRCAGITPYSGHVEETDELLRRIEPVLDRSGSPRARALAEGFRFANARSLGDFAAALECADRVEQIGGMQPVATCWRLGVASLAGDLAEAIQAPEHEDSLGDDPGFIEYARLCGRDPEVDRLGLTAFAAWGLGRDAEAVDRARRATRLAKHSGDARSLIWALFMLCMLHELRRDWPALRSLAPQVDEQAARHEVTPWLGVGVALSRWALSQEQPEPSPTTAAFASIMLDRGHASNVSLRTMLLLLSSRLYAFAGDFAGAARAAGDGLDYCEHTDERHMAPELHRQLGRVHAATGDMAAARDAWGLGLEVARAQGNVVSEVRTLADRTSAGERVDADPSRLRVLRKRLGARFGPHERALLDGLAGS
jgi:DNA-binding winged helix-turn-helix (wHTH) protein